MSKNTNEQLELFEFDSIETIDKIKVDKSEWGTFKDSLRAPVHSWFTYPAGFSFKAVEHTIEESGLKVGIDTIYDPFMGSGTTNIVARVKGINSIGVEAHPFVFPITQSKFYWEIDYNEVKIILDLIEQKLKETTRPEKLLEFLNQAFPELILKCFLPETLFDLLIIRNTINEIDFREDLKNFFRTGLICVLRDVSIAATGWPYIAPNKVKITSKSKNGFDTYKKRIIKMTGDIVSIKNSSYRGETTHQLFFGDSRDTSEFIANESADHIFTSPPYLNNFDYADRTRLEMYFMGIANNWTDISNQVRKKLMTSATTQISRNDEKYTFDEDFKNECSEVYEFLNDAVNKLKELRLTKGGKKSYDLMTIGYFNDMYKIIKDNFRILKPNSKALYILGDSAPYGVHIPTDVLIGKIGVAIGFKDFKLQILRERGGKWKNNPQRHSVMLQESVVILQK